MAEVSQSNNYVKPEMSDDGALSISDGRHPVIEVLREKLHSKQLTIGQ